MMQIVFTVLSLALLASSSPSLADGSSLRTNDAGSATRPPALSSAPRTAARASSGFDEAHYAKPSELSTRPSPTGEIRVPSPDKAAEKSVVATKVTLFVDEKGAVAKITFDDPALARPFRDAIQSAFATAHFKPGRIGERAVKSRMRIEVTFEPRREEAASSARAQR